ncbi:MAG: hypothetical protein J7621_21325 [Niastella sp.]|nr:hypothetical protein [Niastella sp.]
MDMTHDEAYSFKLIKTNYFTALFGSANTHWLNSFFMEILNMVFGDSPGWLRLHSVMAFPFFAWAIYRLGNFIKGMPARIIFYALLLLNPYVLDFFSLARGYGLAMTFQAWSLVYFVKATTNEFRYRNWLWVFFLHLLAIASNLSYFYTVVGMAAWYAYIILIPKLTGRAIDRRNVWLLIFYFVLLLLTVADLLFIKYYGKDLGYGGDTDLIGSLFGSVWEGSLYGANYGQLLPVLTQVSFYCLVLAGAYYIFHFLRSKIASTGFLLSIPLISILLLNIFFHLLFNTPFLYGRTALQWYIPGILLICIAAGELLSISKVSRIAGAGIATILPVLIVIHHNKQTDRELCFEWSLQANTTKAIHALYMHKPQHPAMGFSVGGVYENYYSLLDSSLHPTPIDLPDQKQDCANPAMKETLQQSDYIITAYPATLLCLQQLGLRYEVIGSYPPGTNQLIRIYH